jgi:hypothetical protein
MHEETINPSEEEQNHGPKKRAENEQGKTNTNKQTTSNRPIL